jgi:hypothetical protein
VTRNIIIGLFRAKESMRYGGMTATVFGVAAGGVGLR